MQIFGDLLSWLAREHCDRNHVAVASAWEKLGNPPTLADCGRLFSAYGKDFPIEEVTYLASHPRALQLARYASGGSSHLTFESTKGYLAAVDFNVPKAGVLARSLVVFMVLMVVLGCIVIWNLSRGWMDAAIASGVILATIFLLTVVEFTDMRGRHHARRAIELSAQPGAIPPNAGD